jgi:hypothetical protein
MDVCRLMGTAIDYIYLVLSVLSMLIYLKYRNISIRLIFKKAIAKMKASSSLLDKSKKFLIWLSAVMSIFILYQIFTKNGDSTFWIIDGISLSIIYLFLGIVGICGIHLFETYIKVAEKYRIKDQVMLLALLSFTQGIMYFWADSNNHGILYAILSISIICILMVIRSVIASLKKEHIYTISTKNRSKALFFIAAYWLFFLQMNLFFLLWGIHDLSFQAFVIDKKPVEVSDLFYFAFTSITTFGPGQVSPGNLTGKIVMGVCAMIDFSYLVFFLNAFVIAYTQIHDEKSRSRKRYMGK